MMGISVSSIETSIVTLAEASILIDRPQNTVRDWVKKSLVTAKTDEKGRWLIERNSLLHRASTMGPKVGSRLSKPQPVQTQGGLDNGFEGSTQALIRRLEKDLEREEKINDELRGKVDRLESELFKINREMQAFLSNNLKDNTISPWVRNRKENLVSEIPVVNADKIIDGNSCKKWYSSKELAQILDMNPKYIRTRFKDLNFEHRTNHADGNRLEFYVNIDEVKELLR